MYVQVAGDSGGTKLWSSIAGLKELQDAFNCIFLVALAFCWQAISIIVEKTISSIALVMLAKHSATSVAKSVLCCNDSLITLVKCICLPWM